MNETEIAERAEALPERFADRLPEPNVDGLRDMAEGGEWGELVSELVAGLVKRQPAVTVAERDELAALLDAMGEPTDGLDTLNVTDQEAS